VRKSEATKSAIPATTTTQRVSLKFPVASRTAPSANGAIADTQ
jgi:hypothetical protein